MTLMESEIVNALNFYYKSKNIAAEAYRLNQSFITNKKTGEVMFGKDQKIDIVSDSLNTLYYLAIECKSMDAHNSQSFNFKSRFSKAHGAFQLDREMNFCRRTGRFGVLAIELRGTKSKISGKSLHLLPLSYVYDTYKRDVPGIKVERIRKFPKIERVSGKYIIEEKFFEDIRKKCLLDPTWVEERGEAKIKREMKLNEIKVKQEQRLAKSVEIESEIEETGIWEMEES